MVEIKINQYTKSFQYDLLDNNIYIGLKQEAYKNLTDKELNIYISNAITHEFIHYLLDKMFNNIVSSLYDYVGDSLSDKKILKKVFKMQGSELWSDAIKHDKKVILNHYCIKNKEIIYITNLCNSREEYKRVKGVYNEIY